MADLTTAPLPPLPSAVPEGVEGVPDPSVPPASNAAPSIVPPPVAAPARRGSANSTSSASVQPTRTSGRARIPSQKATEALSQPEPSSSSSTNPKPSTHKPRRVEGQARSSEEERDSKPLKRGRPPGQSSAGGIAGRAKARQSVSLSSARLPLSNGADAGERLDRLEWSEKEDLRMLALVRVIPSLTWGEIAGRMATGPGGTAVSRPAQGCIKRWYTVLQAKFGGVMRFEPDGKQPAIDEAFDVDTVTHNAPATSRRWTGSEDSDLLLAVRLHGTEWDLVATAIATGEGLTLGPQEDRTPRACRERYASLTNGAVKTLPVGGEAQLGSQEELLDVLDEAEGDQMEVESALNGGSKVSVQPTAPAMVGGVLPGAPGTVSVPMKIVGKKLKRNSQAYQKPTLPATVATPVKSDQTTGGMSSPIVGRISQPLNGGEANATPNKVTLNTSTLPRASLGGASPSLLDQSFGTPGSVASSSAIGGTPMSVGTSAGGTPLSAQGSEPRAPVVRGRRTANLQALQGVLLTPTGKVRKVHECPEPSCTAAFRRSEHLKRHYKSVHIGRRPFPCDWEGCDKTFTRNDNKQQHMSMVHGVKLPTAAAAAGQPGQSSTSPPPAGANGGTPGQEGMMGPPKVMEKETDGGPELAEAFRRKEIRDREAALLAAANAAVADLGAEESGIKAEQSELPRMIGQGQGSYAPLSEQEQEMLGGEVDAEGEEFDESELPPLPQPALIPIPAPVPAPEQVKMSPVPVSNLAQVALPAVSAPAGEEQAREDEEPALKKARLE